MSVLNFLLHYSSFPLTDQDSEAGWSFDLSEKKFTVITPLQSQQTNIIMLPADTVCSNFFCRGKPWYLRCVHCIFWLIEVTVMESCLILGHHSFKNIFWVAIKTCQNLLGNIQPCQPLVWCLHSGNPSCRKLLMDKRNGTDLKFLPIVLAMCRMQALLSITMLQSSW